MPALSRNPQLLRRAQFARFTFCVKSETQARWLSVGDGDVRVLPDLAGAEPNFTLQARDEVWRSYAQAVPPPGYNDILAMVESGQGELDGRDMLPFFSNIFLVKGIVAALIKGDASW
ncbi:hypothetical protein [Hydrogenophaga laconesensis]|nr:hypothetical protein [Hydrogenophaga laconesensis]